MKNLAEKPFALIGVHGLGHEPKKVKAAMQKEKLNWRSFAGSRELNDKWASRGTPTYYILDHKGVIRNKWSGYPGAKALDDALEKLIKAAERQDARK